ncbi:MAG TPA: ABC transporter permease [Methylomirabilota bacterium]|nr:ABC transporter permease [Methylomirabilota bacterium]
MRAFLLTRLGFLIVSVFGAFTIAFLVMRLIPGDPAQVILGDYATKESIARLRETLGLDRPVWVQYVSFVGRALRGDFGVSLVTQRPAFFEVFSVFLPTIQLAAAGALVSMLIGVPAGVLAATRRNRPLDYVTMTLALGSMSMPVFWLGLLLLFVCSFTLGWTPTVGAGGDEGWLSMLHHLVLPALALGLSLGAMVTRMTRSAMLEVLRQDYMRTARAKGLRELLIIGKHGLRNAALPIVTILGINFGIQLGGTILIETVFARPGMGSLLISSIYQRDYPQVQALVMVFATSVVFVNLLVDLVYAVFDPRVRR